jgi:TPR repeat protein
MAVRVTHVAIVVGGACGTFAALVGSPSTSAPLPAPGANLPMRPISEPAVLSATHTAPVPSVASAAPVAAAPIASSSASVAASVAAAPSGAAAPSPSDSERVVIQEPKSGPATKAVLLRAEMHCDQKDAEACIFAAIGYENGSAGPIDLEKAVKYRKIALTLWISQCDHNSASACATLADMYRVGNGVPQNNRNADALLARTRELCHYNDAPVCHELPSP